MIDPGYFSEKKDLDLMKSALSFCLDLLNSEQLSGYVEAIQDYELAKNDPDTYIKNTFFSGHHLIGGCAHLIDENFEVKDNPGMFICDASIFSGSFQAIFTRPLYYWPSFFS